MCKYLVFFDTLSNWNFINMKWPFVPGNNLCAEIDFDIVILAFFILGLAWHLFLHHFIFSLFVFYASHI